jgi:hypothetical protein
MSQMATSACGHGVDLAEAGPLLKYTNHEVGPHTFASVAAAYVKAARQGSRSSVHVPFVEASAR